MKKPLLLCLSLLAALSFGANGQQQDMLNKIESAKRSLSNAENRIVKERVSLSSTLSQLEKDVMTLRDKTAVARRLADEKTLSLQKLEARLGEWKEQQTYQQNLLNRFLQQQGLSFTDVNAMNTADKMAAVSDAAVKTATLPEWTNRTLVMENGELADVPSLAVGPVTWFKNNGTVCKPKGCYRLD